MVTSRQKLYYLLKHYLKGEYRTEDFANQFGIIYGIETDYDSLTEDEHRLFHELCRVTDRFSPYKEDFESCPNFFTTESDVKQKASEVFDCLCGKGKN